MNEERKFAIEEVEAVAAPPRAKVDDAESPADKLGRKRDYLEGFLAEKPPGLASGDPGGDLYESVVAALRDIFDPEIPVNIYDLGLIYGLDVDEESGKVAVRMTLTAPGCPVAETFPGTVQCAVDEVSGVSEASVELVWDPPWSAAQMSEAARLELGML